MTDACASWLELPTTVVTQEMVFREGVNVTNLDAVAGDSYTARGWMPTADWMTQLLGDCTSDAREELEKHGGEGVSYQGKGG